jgi:ribosomal protein S18 acetylase RimI-like enzyme
MRFRAATAEDIERVAALHALSWQTAYASIYRQEYLDSEVGADRLAVWRERLTAPAANQIVTLAEEAGAFLGFACAFGDDDPRWGSLIDNLHVAPHLKRNGIGTRLMQRTAERLGARYSASRVYLWALEANAPARKFYARLGGDHAETLELPTADGGVTSSCRYVWRSPAALGDAAGRLAGSGGE